jgi:hypothetical protein
MGTTAKIVFAGALIGAAAAGGIATANAQYYYPPPPYGYGDGWRTYNGCPPGYTVQGGNCAPYRGPGGGGWRTWNGCPPGYTVKAATAPPTEARSAAHLVDGTATEICGRESARFAPLER